MIYVNCKMQGVLHFEDLLMMPVNNEKATDFQIVKDNKVMGDLIELSLEILEMLKDYGYNSLIHLDEVDFKKKEFIQDAKDYYILKPSIEMVEEDYTEINGQFYSPILSDEIKDMAKNDTPLIDFLLQIDEGVYKELKIK